MQKEEIFFMTPVKKLSNNTQFFHSQFVSLISKEDNMPAAYYFQQQTRCCLGLPKMLFYRCGCTKKRHFEVCLVVLSLIVLHSLKALGKDFADYRMFCDISLAGQTVEPARIETFSLIFA